MMMLGDGMMSLRLVSPRRSLLLLRFLLVATLLGAGFWIRGLSAVHATAGSAKWWPWQKATVVTLYFPNGKCFLPVSRRMPANDDLPRAVLQALLAGPSTASGLTNPMPRGVEIRSFHLVNGVAQIDLSGAVRDQRGELHSAETAIVETMTALPGVSSVALNIEGAPLAEPAKRVPLLYYASANGLVAVPAAATTPRAAVDAYLAGPVDPELTGLPRDIRLLKYKHDPIDGTVSLNFSYTPSVRELAVDKPERMRFALLGLITTLTELPQVRAVRLDFEGRTRLGLGQCSDLLRTLQPRPELLNDERLLGR